MLSICKESDLIGNGNKRNGKQGIEREQKHNINVLEKSDTAFKHFIIN